MPKKSLPLSKVYTLLEPGPVVIVTTAQNGRTNIMAMSWQTMIEFVPPLVGIIVSNRNYSFDLLKATKECVISIPAVEMAKTVVAIGNCSGRTVDKFAKFKLTPLPASLVKPPLIGECFADLECRVIDAKLATKYCLFIVEAVKAWTDPTIKNPRTIHHRGNGVFAVDGEIIKVPSKKP